MSRPLLAIYTRRSEAKRFHDACFRYHGRACWKCGNAATDAAHIIPRSQLGPQRYACPVENARPACRRCHDRQERHEIAFPKAWRLKAIRALNRVLRVKIVESAA